MLVLLAGYFGDPTDPRLIGGSVSIELVHLATLYHDDVIDEADARRGAPSANMRWDNTVAILTGDFLFARASEISTELGTDVCRLLARTIADPVRRADPRGRQLGEGRAAREQLPGDHPAQDRVADRARRADWAACSRTPRPSAPTSWRSSATPSAWPSSSPTTSWTSPPPSSNWARSRGRPAAGRVHGAGPARAGPRRAPRGAGPDPRPRRARRRAPGPGARDRARRRRRSTTPAGP